MSIIAEKDCGRIQASLGSNALEFFLSGGNTGLGKPVWKLKDRDFYIFNDGSSAGLRIGNGENLKSGSSFYESKKYDNFLFETCTDFFLFRWK